MRNVYVVSDNIYSPLGRNTLTNMTALKSGETGIQPYRSGLSEELYYASLLSPQHKPGTESLTAFEYIMLASAREAMQNADVDPRDKKTGFILSSTKGNISLIENADAKPFPERRISLHTSASIIAREFGFVSDPLVVSHACISGLLAMITGMRLIQSGAYDQVVISGGDLITSFIYSGFRSFQAISLNPCKPFDAMRDGISLGEAAASVVLSAHKISGAVKVGGGSVSNDANHISGPSRTGEELFLAIQRTLQQADTGPEEIDFISAHGTATRYNDEMEARAINLAKMENTPVNSLKSYYGHTLGAAGILESVITIHSMKENIMLPTKGFSEPGTEKPVNIIKELKHVNLQKCLKTASGFGGCNAAVIFEKV
jgi:3-oxoacyl-[acyl-carrier-protein] synthase I